MAAAEQAALDLRAEPELDRRRRYAGDNYAEKGDGAQRRIDDREPDDDRTEDHPDAARYRLGLAAPYAGSRHRGGGDQVRRILAGNGKPGEAACQLSCGHD